ncbi:MAG: thioredoxin family protein, partial [Pyrinomonadaceae bacterium]|nr:thioredoxin family protein [Phycisphaerales bacterium]
VPNSSPAAATMPSLFGFQSLNPNSAVGITVLLLISVLGGVILNLTPCVLPVIPIKVLTLSQHAGGSRSKALKLGIWMALGVIAFWMMIGIPMAFFSSALDPSRIIFGTWWVTLSIGLVITAMGFGIMGLFAINLPQSVYMVNPKADSPSGSFMFGIMTAVLGLPCFGFVAGGLLAGAATLPAITIMVVFIGIGVGMAAPYLLLSANPQWVEKLPRTGPASELIKQVMGLLLLAAAAYFIFAGINGLMSGRPYLKESLPWWGVAFFVVLTGIWLTVRTLQISRKTWPKIAMPLLSALAILAFVGFAGSLASTAREDYQRQHAGAMSDDSIITGAWLSYNPSRLKKAQESGKIIVADFTADWCINCKVLKRTFLDRDPVRAALTSGDIIMLEVDCTNGDAPGWTWLRELGRTAVPTLAIFAPGMESPIIYNAYTSDTIMDGLAKARLALAESAASTALAAAPGPDPAKIDARLPKKGN